MIVVFCNSQRKELLSSVALELNHLSVPYRTLVNGIEGAAFCFENGTELVGRIEVIPGVSQVLTFDNAYALVDRRLRPGGTVVRLRNVDVGDGGIAVLPISGEEVNSDLSFSDRTSEFSVAGCPALRMLEVRSPEGMAEAARSADLLIIGPENMQNYRLLESVGVGRVPVLLKRGPMASLDELLSAAEYILLGGNDQVILCESGVRSFDSRIIRTLDFGAVSQLRHLTHLPVVVDPCSGAVSGDVAAKLARASVAVGADGILLEVFESECGEPLLFSVSPGQDSFRDFIEGLDSADWATVRPLIGLRTRH